MMEKWDLYTKYRERTGLEHTRGGGNSQWILSSCRSCMDKKQQGGICNRPACCRPADLSA